MISRSFARAFVLMLSLAACEADRCDHYYAGLQSYSPPSNAYTLRYQSPPWDLVSHEAESAVLRIERTRIFDVDADVPSKFTLTVDVDPTLTAAARLNAEKTSAMARGEEIVLDLRPVSTESGATGVEFFSTLVTEYQTRSYRYVSIDAPVGSVHLFFEADPMLNNAEVDAMIKVFSVGTAMGAPALDATVTHAMDGAAEQ